MPEILPEKALLSSLINNKKDIAILVGSPLSMPDNTSKNGVPGVTGVLELISKHLEDKGLLEDYVKSIDKDNDADKYQQAFAFVKGWLGQEDVNEIIQKAVLKSVKEELKDNPLAELNQNEHAWYFPSASEFVGKIVASENKFKGPILTTNFDPLLSLSIKKHGGHCTQTILHSDGDLSQHRSISDACNVVHLHGYWLDSDTLHTPDQLKASRPKLKVSLSNLLRDKMLFVIGYGGWDDVFIQAITELMSDANAPLDVVWAFFESDNTIIEKKYEHLLASVKPAIDRGRFRMYGGIDCHSFLPKLHIELAKDKSKSPSNIIASTAPKDRATELLLSLEGDDKDLFVTSSLPRWRYKCDQAHLYIRETEQEQFIGLLQHNRFANLAIDWGMARLPFLYSITNSRNSPFHKQPIYLFDFEGVNSRDDIFKVVKDQVGIELQQLIKEISEEPSILVFDNIDNEHSDSFDFINILIDISETIIEFSHNIKVIVGSRKAIINDDLPRLEVGPLVDYDVKKYVENHSEGGKDYCESATLDLLIRISEGAPMLLDRALAQLKFITINELIESNFRSDEISSKNNEPIPQTLINTIDGLSNSSATVEKHAYNLLKILSVLSFGDTFKNVRKSLPTRPFHSSHLEQLYSLDLLSSQNLNLNRNNLLGESKSIREDLKLLIVPTLVREYVYNKLSSKEVYEIVKRAADNHFGEKWKQGSPKLCSTSQQLLGDKNKNMGSSQIIITQLLRAAIEQNDSRAIKQSYNIAIYYCSLLKNKSRFRELVMFGNDIRAVLSDTTVEIELYRLHRFMGAALRMVDDNNKAIEYIEMALSDENANINKNDKVSMYSDIAFSYDHLSNSPQAIIYANKVQELVKKGTGRYRDAEYIKIKNTSTNKIKKLTVLEKNAAKNKFYTVADNTALIIADLEDDSNKKLACYQRVLDRPGDSYNKYRGVNKKYDLIINENEFNSITNKDLILLSSAYILSYNQHFDLMFNQSHKALWAEAERREDIISLVKLFKLSSLYWRLIGEKDDEQYYAEKLIIHLSSLSIEKIKISDLSYVEIRVKQLS